MTLSHALNRHVRVLLAAICALALVAALAHAADDASAAKKKCKKGYVLKTVTKGKGKKKRKVKVCKKKVVKKQVAPPAPPLVVPPPAVSIEPPPGDGSILSVGITVTAGDGGVYVNASVTQNAAVARQWSVTRKLTYWNNTTATQPYGYETTSSNSITSHFTYFISSAALAGVEYVSFFFDVKESNQASIPDL